MTRQSCIPRGFGRMFLVFCLNVLPAPGLASSVLRETYHQLALYLDCTREQICHFHLVSKEYLHHLKRLASVSCKSFVTICQSLLPLVIRNRLQLEVKGSCCCFQYQGICNVVKLPVSLDSKMSEQVFWAPFEWPPISLFAHGFLVVHAFFSAYKFWQT